MKEMFRKGRLLRGTVPPTPPPGKQKKETNLAEKEKQQPLEPRILSLQVETNSETPGKSKSERKLLSELRMTSCQNSTSTSIKAIAKPK